MDNSPDKEMKELMEEMADDLGYADDNGGEARLEKPPDSKTRRKIMVLWGGVIFLVIILIAILFSGGSKVGTESSIQPRLDQIEQRLDRLEGMYERIVRLEKQEQGLQQFITKVDRFGQSLGKRLDKLVLGVEKQRKRQATVVEKTEAPPAGRKKEISEAKRQYHMVRSGDSLYSIARKYGTSVAELRRLNNIRPKQDIFPGQKILVGKGSGQ